MWKVRFIGEGGDLYETEFSGSLVELAAEFSGKGLEVIVAQRPMPAKAGPGDAAEGSSSIDVQKG